MSGCGSSKGMQLSLVALITTSFVAHSMTSLSPEFLLIFLRIASTPLNPRGTLSGFGVDL